MHLGRHGQLLIGVDEEPDKGNIVHEIKVNVVLQMLLTCTFHLISILCHIIAEMYQRTSAKSLTDPQAEPDKFEEDMESFTVSLFPISEQNKVQTGLLYV